MTREPSAAVRVHIDRLVVDVASVRADELGRLRGDVEAEIRRQFAGTPASARRRRGRQATTAAGTPVARAIATAVHRAAGGAR